MQTFTTSLKAICLTLLLFSCTKESMDTPGTLVPQTTDQDPKLPSLDVNGNLLHLETFGDIENPIIIFLHGGPGFDYKSMISEDGKGLAHRYPEKRTETHLGLSALQNEYFLVFYDRRGSGLSPRFDADGIVFDDQLDDLKTIIAHFLDEKEKATSVRDEKVNLFGWSFGGYLATALVNDTPDLVEHLMLYEPRPFSNEIFDLMTVTSPFGQLTEDYVDGVATGGTFVLNTSHETADYQWAIGASGDFFPEFHNPENLPFWRVGFQVNHDVDLEVTRENRVVTDRLDQFSGKTLYLVGQLSARDAAGPGFMEQMTAFFPDARVQEIENAGHFGPWDAPQPIVSHMRSFLN